MGNVGNRLVEVEYYKDYQKIFIVDNRLVEDHDRLKREICDKLGPQEMDIYSIEGESIPGYSRVKLKYYKSVKEIC